MIRVNIIFGDFLNVFTTESLKLNQGGKEIIELTVKWSNVLYFLPGLITSLLLPL